MVVAGMALIEPTMVRMVVNVFGIEQPLGYYLGIAPIYIILIILIIKERNEVKGRWVFKWAIGLFLFAMLLASCFPILDEKEEIICYEIYQPVCADGELFPNDCYAMKAGYKNEELTPAQKKLPPALQKAIAKKMKDKKEEVEETHSYHKIKQNKKQTQADGEKEIIDPNPKLKAEDVIRGLWEKAAETVSETDITKDNIKKGDSEKEKELKIKLDKEKDQDTLEKQLIAAQGQINILKQKLENEKNKAIKPEPNPETGEVPLTVGVAYKHLRDKMKKEEKNPDIVSDDEKKEKKTKGKADTGSPKTPVDTEPQVDYKN